MSGEAVAALGVLCAAIVTGLVTYLVATQGQRADRASHFTDALLKRVDQLNSRVDQLEDRTETLEHEVHILRTWRNRAVDYIRTLLRTLRVHSIDIPEPPDGLDLE